MKPDYRQTVLAYKDTVYRIAYSQCSCREDAEDIFQDVFLTLCREKREFDSEDHLRYWLIRVTLNYCRLLRRSAWHRKRAEVTGDIPAPETPGERDMAETVTEAVRALPEKYRAIVEMHYFEEMTCAEIGAALKLNEATVRTRLRRGRERLREYLENDMEAVKK